MVSLLKTSHWWCNILKFIFFQFLFNSFIFLICNCALTYSMSSISDEIQRQRINLSIQHTIASLPPWAVWTQITSSRASFILLLIGIVMFTNFFFLNSIIDNIAIVVFRPKSRLWIRRFQFINELLQIQIHLFSQRKLWTRRTIRHVLSVVVCFLKFRAFFNWLIVNHTQSATKLPTRLSSSSSTSSRLRIIVIWTFFIKIIAENAFVNDLW